MSLVNTHLGRVSVTDLGITLVHEHIFNRYPYRHKSVSEAFTLKQIRQLKKYDVKTVVDLTPYASLGNYKRILEEVDDIHIVCCLGFYLPRYISSAYKKYTVSELVRRLSKRIENGMGSDKIRPGVLKVAGQREILSPMEERFFSTVGILQRKYHLPIAVHSPQGAVSYLRYLSQVGANPQHIYFSHLDRGLTRSRLRFDKRVDEMLCILKQGSYVLFSEFGNKSHHTNASILTTRLITIAKDAGYIRQILISADSNWKWKRGQVHLKGSQKGGIPRTYDYVFTRIQPLLRESGFSDEDLNTILITNPMNLFST